MDVSGLGSVCQSVQWWILSAACNDLSIRRRSCSPVAVSGREKHVVCDCDVHVPRVASVPFSAPTYIGLSVDCCKLNCLVVVWTGHKDIQILCHLCYFNQKYTAASVWKFYCCPKFLKLKMQYLRPKKTFFFRNFGAELKFWAPIIFSVGNLQMSVRILSEMCNMSVRKLQLSVSSTCSTQLNTQYHYL